jgi:hypothetical protein
MLHAGQSFNKDWSIGTVPPNIADDRAPSGPKLEASDTFLHFDNA